MADYGTSAPASATTEVSTSPLQEPAAAMEKPNADERVVFQMLARAAADLDAQHDRDLTRDDNARACMNAQYLIQLAKEIAERMAAEGAVGDPCLSIARLEALLEGAHALDVAQQPGASDRHERTHRAFKLAESASISYGFGQEGCEALAQGARAALGQRPASGHSVEQLKIALGTVASHLATMHRLVMMLQGQDCGTDFGSDVLDSIELITRVAGGVADEFSGRNVLGDRDHWTFGASMAHAESAA
ncbi:MAG: hypothetical protein DI587_31295 [Variovorax paradoxus]|nr:MAG: hypothetical protein DI583_31295 [Variovorax paradoxus]PZQ03147.1 MAG: hypothetical protein DI587_31295 [Variovorax paradoxus]